MGAVISVLVILTLSILITRIATVALIHTGLSKETARFQARSAFSGVGFTTGEAEGVVSHPVRRRIIMALMLMGNIGIVSVITSVILTVVEERGALGVPFEYRVPLLLVGIAGLLYLGRSAVVDRALGRLINWALLRWTNLAVQDYVSLLRLSGPYEVRELLVEQQDWLTDKDLAELRLRDEGVQVLGIVRSDNTYVGVPDGSTRVSAGDMLILYGRAESLNALDRRVRGAQGDLEHERAIAEQAEVQRRGPA